MNVSRAWIILGALALPGCGDDAGTNRATVAPAVSTAGLPVRTGWVVDQANLIPQDKEAYFTGRLAALEHRTGRQFFVVTVKGLGAEPIEDYGRRLGTAWAVGGQGRYDGVLLIVAPDEKKVRIATGRGLRPVLTDEMCAEIINRDMLPRFRNGKMLEAIEAGIDAVSNRLVSAGQPTRKAA
jgi:uncharacterized protein